MGVLNLKNRKLVSGKKCRNHYSFFKSLFLVTFILSFNIFFSFQFQIVVFRFSKPLATICHHIHWAFSVVSLTLHQSNCFETEVHTNTAGICKPSEWRMYVEGHALAFLDAIKLNLTLSKPLDWLHLLAWEIMPQNATKRILLCLFSEWSFVALRSYLMCIKFRHVWNASRCFWLQPLVFSLSSAADPSVCPLAVWKQFWNNCQGTYVFVEASTRWAQQGLKFKVHPPNKTQGFSHWEDGDTDPSG